MTTERQKQQQKRWHEKHDGPKGVIGEVPKYAPGREEMRNTATWSALDMARNLGPFMSLLRPKKKKMKTELQATSVGYIRKDTPTEDEEL